MCIRDRSWVGTLGAILDATTLLITTVDLDHRGEAAITARIGTHLVHDFSNFFRLPRTDAAGVDYDEFVLAYRCLLYTSSRISAHRSILPARRC